MQPRNREIVPFSDLCELSGRERPSAVRKWLQKHQIPYYVDADGRPCTTATALYLPLDRSWITQPNFEAARS